VRTRAGAETLLGPQIERVVRELDAELPVYDVRTLTDHVEKNLFLRRIPARIFVVLGPVLLGLAAIGIYAVVAYTVSQRTKEIGVRLALGATANGLVRRILADTLRTVAVGAMIGWALFVFVNLHLIRGPLYLSVFLGCTGAPDARGRGGVLGAGEAGGQRRSHGGAQAGVSRWGPAVAGSARTGCKVSRMRDVTRRECLGMLSAAAFGPRLTRADTSSAKPMRGAFMILSTPFTDSGEVDWDDLAREASFVDRCGAHGIVWPQGSSSVANLTKAERLRGMEVLATAVQDRRTALVLGVQGPTAAEMLEYARRAEALAPDALIAMPPSAAKTLDDYREYFRALGQATKRPVFVQTSGGARELVPSVDLMVESRPGIPARGVRQGGIGAARRADDRGTRAPPSTQGCLRRLIRRRLVVRDAPRARRRHDRDGDVRGSDGADVGAARARRG
jgi:hypothetical protein